MAEAWLIAQDPYLKSEEFGHSIDEVENLIKKHEAFEKAAAAQEERFAALERLTTVEIFFIHSKKIIFRHIVYSVRAERHEAPAGRGDDAPAGPHQEAGRN